jgi:diaminohydroxyphosphoribosylaminopyrimidine deaminase/5-amino-6-(5-phosphoribosylamino)uracil reductase
MAKTDDRDWLIQAIELSRLCPPTEKAFSVGAIIVSADGELLSTGYSRERDVTEHAEERAIAKACEGGRNLSGATIYSSLEPCHPRLSGKTSCTDLIIRAGITRVVFALNEPPRFVICDGANRLKSHNIEVVLIDELAHLARPLIEAPPSLTQSTD